MTATKDYKIWYLAAPGIVGLIRRFFLGFRTSPVGINYKTGLRKRLHPVHTFVKGELVEVKYFANIDEFGYNDLVLCVTVIWQRDENGILVRRVETRKWTTIDSTDETPEFGPDTKTTTKVYTVSQSEKADIRRRKNIVHDLTSLARGFGTLDETRTMFKVLNAELFAYEESGNTDLLQAIMDYLPGVPWLDDLINTMPGFDAYPDKDPYAPTEDLTIRRAIRNQLDVTL